MNCVNFESHTDGKIAGKIHIFLDKRAILIHSHKNSHITREKFIAIRKIGTFACEFRIFSN